MHRRSTREEDDRANRNILGNQLRLLPKHRQAVDKVIVYGSPRLEDYYAHSFTAQYLSAVERAYTHDGTAQTEIHDIIEREYGTEGFHHVLTELAFLNIRKTHLNKEHGIIPVRIDETPMKYLWHLPQTDLWQKSSSKVTDHYKLFFKMLQQIYPEQCEMITAFMKCYEICHAQFQKGPLVNSDIDKIVSEELMLTAISFQEDIITAVRQARNPGKAHFMVPLSRNRNFVGRESEL